ncbi:MAG: hypothetical protein WB502_12450, partial [Thermoactinomyces sp.]
MGTPEHIKKIIENYKKTGENVVIMPEVIKYHNQIYYGASYHKDRETRGYLILKEDGIIPLKNEIMEIFFIALGISTIYDAFFRIAVGQMKRRYHLVKWANKVLKKLEQKYVKKSEELKHIQSYLKMTESTLQNQHKFKKFGLEQERLLFLVKNEGIITSDLYYKAQKLQSKMGRCLFFINYDQMQSYQDRKKAINFLIKKGDFFPALLLFLVHSQLHPPYVK